MRIERAPALGFLLLALGVAGLVLCAFVLEYGFGVLPCKMCWWQRYIHWAIGGLALFGWLVSERCVRLVGALGIATLALAGLYIAVWQFSAQHGWLPFPPSCVSEGGSMADAGDLLNAMQHTKVIPCDKETFTLMGLSLAGWNIPVMLGYVVAGVWLGRRVRVK